MVNSPTTTAPSASNSDLQSAFTCPLTGSLYRDPVVLGYPGTDGTSYERSAIEARFAANNFADPKTQQPLPMDTLMLIPNTILARLAAEAARLQLFA